MERSLTPTEFSSAVTAITSAFGDPTRRQIYLFVRGHSDVATRDDGAVEATGGGVTAAEVASPSRCTPTWPATTSTSWPAGATSRWPPTAPAPAPAAPPSATGSRPPRWPSSCPSARTSCWSPCSGERWPCSPTTPPRQWPRRSGSSTGGRWPWPWAARMRRSSSSTVVPRSFRAALHVVADALTAHGFAAHAERHDDGLRIVSDHCPFGEAAIEHPVLCAVDRGHRAGHAERPVRRGRRGHVVQPADGRRPVHHLHHRLIPRRRS